MKTYSTQTALKNYLLVFVIMLITLSAQSQTSVNNISVSNLASFNVLANAGKAKLAFVLTENNTASTVVLEKSNDGTAFQPMAEFWVNMEGNTQKDFTYTNNRAGEASVYYRLQVIGKDGKVQYSNVILFNNQQAKAATAGI